MTLFSVVVHCPMLLFIGVPVLCTVIAYAKFPIPFKLGTPGFE